jgi:superfamily II DNA or RNA helicase
MEEQMETLQQQVLECLRFLAHNDLLSGSDAILSNNLADLATLSTAQMVFGARLARRYPQEVEAAGLMVPAAEAIDSYLEREQERAGREAEAAAGITAENLEALLKSPSRVTLATDVGDKVLIMVEFPFDRAKVTAVQALKERIQGWMFDHFSKKDWCYPVGPENAALVVDALAPFPDFAIGPGIRSYVGRARYLEVSGRELAELEASVLELERETALQVAHPYLQGKPLADGHPLYQHQREAVRTLISQQRAVLAHDLGLGKTRVALIAAKAYGLPLLVIAPVGLHINWQREAEAAQVPISGLISWAKIPEPPDQDYVLIADEAHYAMNLDSIRTQAFLKLAEQAHTCWPLTGTPMKNARPINLLPLLMAIRHPLAANRGHYEKYFCAGYHRSVGRKNSVYDVSGAAHLDELHQQIKDQVLYRKKEECLDLPPKTRTTRTAEATGQALKHYQQTQDRLRKEHERRMQAKAEERVQELLALLGEEQGAQVDRAALVAELAQDDNNAVALIEMGLLRHAGSLAKVESAVELAQEVLDEGESIVIFTTYRDTADQLAAKLACDILNGDTPKKERQHLIDQFQARESKALVCTIGAGGEGITLTAAQTVLLVDRPWTPGEAVQCEDRLHRIGQKDAVTSIWLQFGRLDSRIDALLQQKQQVIDQVLAGKRATAGNVPSVRALAAEIIASVHNDIPVEAFLAAHGLALPDGSELLEETAAPETEQTGGPRRRTRRHRPQNGLRKDGGQDKRVKGKAPRQRLDVKLDPEVIAFLRTLKTESQNTSKEAGYSGFLEDQVRASAAFQRWQRKQS